MSQRWAVRLASSLGVIGLGLVAVAVAFFAAGGYTAHNLYGNEAGITLGFCAVGAVLAARVPRNSLGWLLLVTGVISAVGLATLEFVSWLGPQRVHEVPVGLVTYAEVSWLPGVVLLFTFVPLLFPTGRPLEGRWHWLLWAAGFAFVVAVFGVLTNTREWQEFHVLNPVYSPTVGKAGAPAFPLMLATALGCIASAIIRYRRAHGALRDQLRWFALASAVVTATIGVEVIVNAHNAASVIAQFIAVFGVPLSIGMAILRYRLYDIDHIVSRTVTYAIVTGVVVGVYVAGVAGVDAVLGSSSSVAVAASTLAAAAIFQPARRRVQRAVDRRFNRAAYDAQRTVEAFTTRLRGQVDVDGVNADLVATVERAVQPARVSVWLAS